MGLDISPGDAHWSYGGFHHFRERLATIEGFTLDEMSGFAPFDAPQDWTGRSWDDVDTPLKPLLNHSDCDGDLSPEECAQIAPRLREVVIALWPDENDYNRKSGLALAEGMERAAAAGERLEFC